MKRLIFVASTLLIGNLFPVHYVLAETTDGATLASEMNSRFADVVTDCDGKSPYYCSGILIRTNEQTKSPDYSPTWVPADSGLERGAIAFSFIRSDISDATSSIWGYQGSGFGIILKPRNQGEYSTRCIFPMNGVSVRNKDNGCGDREKNLNSDSEDNSNCASKNITTAEEWMAQITYKNPIEPEVCSFNIHSTVTFGEALKAQNLLHQRANDEGWISEYKKMWNEVVVSASPSDWSTEDPGKDSIQAIWYHKSASQATLTGLKGAQREQQEYFNITQQWVPIISIDSSLADAPFNYSAEEQAVPEPALR